jgi:hypothetical protein
LKHFQTQGLRILYFTLFQSNPNLSTKSEEPIILDCTICEQILEYLEPRMKTSQKEIDSYMRTKDVTTTAFHITSHLVANRLATVTTEGIARKRYVTILDRGKRSLAEIRKKKAEGKA